MSGMFTHIPLHQDLAVTLMDTPGYFLQLSLLSYPLSLLRTPSILVHNNNCLITNEIKDQNFNDSTQSSFDLTDEQTTSTQCLHQLHNTIYFGTLW